MLKDDFYKIIDLEDNSSSLHVVLELNPDHDIFKGHFPGMPVVPGVCMMQMVKEIVEMRACKPVLLTRADSVKFLVVVDPLVNTIISIDLSYKVIDDSIDVSANLSVGETVCFKCKGRYLVG